MARGVSSHRALASQWGALSHGWQLCSLLRSPDLVHETTAALVKMVEGRVPVTVKMRSGFEDTTLFDDNLLAIQSAGASCVTVHPRTRNQGYDGRADWSLVMRAKKLLSIPVVCTCGRLMTGPVRALHRRDICTILAEWLICIVTQISLQRNRLLTDFDDGGL
jgi:hypothetical protein